LHRFIHAGAYFCILFIVVSRTCGADVKTKFTLSEAIAEARAKNPEMLALEASVASARGGVTTAKTYANPELTIEPGIRRALENDSFVAAFNGVLSISQPFKFPGKRTLEIAIAQTDVKLREMAIEAFRFQIAAKVSRGFYDMLTAQKIVAARAEQVASAKVFVELVKNASRVDTLATSRHSRAKRI
jgi:cobalt-zinc-cadmium efflux system outer membrane protein